MSDDDVIRDRLDELTRELRKQGRAAIAAQAAAEACLDVLASKRDRAGADGDWLRSLIPIFDALGRARAEARALGERAKSARRLSLVFDWPKADVIRLSEGIELVCRELDDALERLGVTIVAPESGPVDPELCRVVETRAGSPEGHVVELVRNGYVLDDRVVREADVVATNRQQTTRQAR
jgi:molecular chaperone GrpE (heat shock protein)